MTPLKVFNYPKKCIAYKTSLITIMNSTFGLVNIPFDYSLYKADAGQTRAFWGQKLFGLNDLFVRVYHLVKLLRKPFYHVHPNPLITFISVVSFIKKKKWT